MSGAVGGLFVSFLDCRRKEKPPRLEWEMEVINYRSGISFLKTISLMKSMTERSFFFFFS